MALRFVDSFDHYASGDIAMKWTAVTGAGTDLHIDANGRNGSALLTDQGANGNASLTIDSQATWIVGFAFKMDSPPSSTRILVGFFDTATLHVDLRLNAASNLLVTRNGTTLATGTATLLEDVWYYIEIKVTIADAGGVAVVKVNGVTDINFSGDTRNAANASANVIALFGTNTAYNYRLDDLYICDGTGSVNNDFLGDIRVAALLPSGNGTSSDFTGSDGNSTDNYLLVDEASQNGDTDYVEESTAGDHDTYAMGDLPSVPTSIKGIQQVLVARKTDAGARTGRMVLRRSGTDYEGADMALTDSYLVWRQIRELDPSTSAAWTEAGVNAIEHGPKCQT